MSGLIVEARAVSPRVGRDFPRPSYATDGAAGMDLRACLDAPAEIRPGKVVRIPTGVALYVRDPRHFILLAPRSGLSVRRGVVLANTVGVVDSDYQDEIVAALLNRGKSKYIVQPGERICQALFLPLARAELKFVEQFSEVTDRNTGGFGSTGRF